MGYRERDRSTWEKIFRDADAGWLAAPPTPLMHRAAGFFRASGARRILDAGSGFGRWAVFLVESLGSRVEALDYAIGGGRMAQELIAGRELPVAILSGSVTELPFVDHCFDGILAVLVLDNLERADARASMLELTRVARPGAALFAVFNPGERPSGDGTNPTASCHSESYTREEIAQLLHGWSIVDETIDEHSLRAFGAKLNA
ncbi:MAG: class I SAM-dependent methyltransferase [Thermoanaerobaculia bacterium]